MTDEQEGPYNGPHGLLALECGDCEETEWQVYGIPGLGFNVQILECANCGFEFDGV